MTIYTFKEFEERIKRDKEDTPMLRTFIGDLEELMMEVFEEHEDFTYRDDDTYRDDEGMVYTLEEVIESRKDTVFSKDEWERFCSLIHAYVKDKEEKRNANRT